MSNVVLPQDGITREIYRNKGPGAKTQKRFTWSKELTSNEARAYVTKDIIGGNSWIRSPPAPPAVSTVIPRKVKNNKKNN
ncbi:hypothetical protein SLA2020_142700 [Shorea laevis]